MKHQHITSVCTVYVFVAQTYSTDQGLSCKVEASIIKKLCKCLTTVAKTIKSFAHGDQTRLGRSKVTSESENKFISEPQVRKTSDQLPLKHKPSSMLLEIQMFQHQLFREDGQSGRVQNKKRFEEKKKQSGL